MALDNGLHLLIGAYRETLRLITLVSRPSDPPGLLRVPLDLEIHPHFRLRAARLPAPLHVIAALATARGLSWSERLQMIAFMLALRRQRFRLDRDVSVSQLLNRHNQSEKLCRYLWHPLCISALNTRPEQASAQVFVSVLRDSLSGSRSDSDFLLPTVDLSRLFPERATRFVSERGGSVLFDCPVLTVKHEHGAFNVYTAQGAHPFSHVVLAVSAHRLRTLCADFPQLTETIHCVEQFDYRPIYSVYLQYSAATRLPRPMLGFENRTTQWVFDRGQLCAQDGLLRVAISARSRPPRGSHHDVTGGKRANGVQTALSWPTREPLWHQVIAGAARYLRLHGRA